MMQVISDYVYGRCEWNGDGWSIVRDCEGPVLFQPVSFLAACGDPIAECCRQNWIDKQHHFFAVPVHHEYLHAIGAGADIEGDKVDALDFAFDVAGDRPFKQHVSFPALHVGAGVGAGLGFFGVAHGSFSESQDSAQPMGLSLESQSPLSGQFARGAA